MDFIWGKVDQRRDSACGVLLGVWGKIVAGRGEGGGVVQGAGMLPRPLYIV